MWPITSSRCELRSDNTHSCSRSMCLGMFSITWLLATIVIRVAHAREALLLYFPRVILYGMQIIGLFQQSVQLKHSILGPNFSNVCYKFSHVKLYLCTVKLFTARALGPWGEKIFPVAISRDTRILGLVNNFTMNHKLQVTFTDCAYLCGVV